jgi:hypothetical protein
VASDSRRKRQGLNADCPIQAVVDGMLRHGTPGRAADSARVRDGGIHVSQGDAVPVEIVTSGSTPPGQL